MIRGRPIAGTDAGFTDLAGIGGVDRPFVDILTADAAVRPHSTQLVAPQFSVGKQHAFHGITTGVVKRRINFLHNPFPIKREPQRIYRP